MKILTSGNILSSVMSLSVISLFVVSCCAPCPPDQVVDNPPGNIPVSEYFQNSDAWKGSWTNLGAGRSELKLTAANEEDRVLGGSITKAKLQAMLHKMESTGAEELYFRFNTNAAGRLQVMFRAGQADPLIYMSDLFCPVHCDTP